MGEHFFLGMIEGTLNRHGRNNSVKFFEYKGWRRRQEAFEYMHALKTWKTHLREEL